MSKDTSNVRSAFELLLEEIETEISVFNEIAASAIEKGSYQKAKEDIDRAEKITKFREKIITLRNEWSELEKSLGKIEKELDSSNQRNVRLSRGIRTSEEEYYPFILNAIVQLGGRANCSDVIEKVGESMKGILKDVDYEPLPSNPRITRWRNTVQWARNALVIRGFLASDSPRGIWEITNEGKQALERMRLEVK